MKSTVIFACFGSFSCARKCREMFSRDRDLVLRGNWSLLDVRRRTPPLWPDCNM